MQLRLVPLDDSILFPGMTATIAADVGDAEQVFVLPRPDGEYGRIGTIAEVVDKGRLPGGINAVTLTGPAPRPRRAGRVRPRRRARDRGRASSTTRPTPATGSASSSATTAPWSRRSSSCAATTAAWRPSCARSPSPGALADTSGYSPDLALADKQRLLETVDVTERLELALELQRERLAELQVRQPDPRRRRVRRPGPAARVLPAQADGVDPQGAGRGRRLGRRRVRDARSTSRRCPTRSASRPSASSAGSSAWASRAASRR